MLVPKKIFIAFFVIGFMALPVALRAATPKFVATRMIATPPATSLDQLEVYSYIIGFKNTGSETWTRTGASGVTVKTTESIRYEHWFASSAWIDKVTVARLNSETVKPGEVGFFNLILEAPRNSKSFTNNFALFTGSTKIASTDFSLPITVTGKIASATKRVVPKPTTPNTTAAGSSVSTASAAGDLKTSTIAKAQLLLRSTSSLTLDSGATSSEIKVGFKNTGDRYWRHAAPSLVTLQIDPSSTSAPFQHSSWKDTTTATTLSVPLTKIGELGFFTFTVKAPTTAGTFTPKFRLVLHGTEIIPGSEFTLPITVTAPAAPTPPPAILAVAPIQNANPNIVCAAANDTSAIPTITDPAQVQTPDANQSGLCSPPRVEPTIRVGIATVQGQLGLTAAQDYQVKDSTGAVVMNVPANVSIFTSYDISSKLYTVVGPGPILSSPTPYLISGTTTPSIMTLVTFSNPAAFDAKLNDNVYRGAIQVQWSNADQKLWIINELKMEEYLKGLAEDSNRTPAEYQKALMIAARTYALYHLDTNSKNRARNFHVYASTQDQYYRGYNSEQRLPNMAAAVDATRGQVVTYQGQVVITPYAASTNGMSKTWQDVWGGTNKPWLVRQVIPEDSGRRLYGHGVGLSQLAAADQAKAGKNYIEILKFFYVGIDVSQWYS